jgi:4-hydroxybenzoate polyprenyltransferase
VFWPIAVYFGVNLAYSLRLKHVPLVDVFTLAAGFVLRTLQGYLAAGAAVSPWLLVCIFSACLLLGLGKRRHELTAAGADHRPALQGYSLDLADHLIVLNAAVTITTYLLFLDSELTFAPYGQRAVLLSAPFALFALSRYLQLLLVHRRGGNPTRMLLRDRVMVANSVLWAVLIGGFLLAAHYPQTMTQLLHHVA